MLNLFRHISWSLTKLIVFIGALLAALIIFVLGTEPGLKISLTLLANHGKANHFASKEIHGTWLTDIQLRDVTLSRPELSMTADQIDLTLNLHAILRGALQFDQLTLGTITIHRQSITQTRSDSSLRVKIHWNNVTAKSIHLHDNQSEYQLNDLHASGFVRTNKRGLSIHIKPTQAMLNKQKLFINGKMQLNNNTLDIESFTGVYGDNRAEIKGQIGSINNLKWNITYQDQDKQLHAHGQISGSQEHPILQANITANGQHGDWKIKQLSANLALGMANAQTNHINLSAKSVSSPHGDFSDLQFNAIGALQNQLLTTEFTHSQTGKQIFQGQWHWPSLNHWIQQIMTKQSFNPPLNAQLLWQGSPINAFKQQLPSDLQSLQGKLHADLHIGGTFNEPTINGKASLTDGQLQLPALGTSLDEITVNAKPHATQKATWILQGDAKLGDGKLDFNADINTQTQSAHATLQGKNLLILKTSDYEIWVDPDLQLSFVDNILTSKGKLHIPRARITPKAFDELEALSEDVIIVNQQKTQTPMPFANIKHNMDIQLSIGKDAKVSYKALTADLGGELQITQTPDHPMIASGEIRLLKGQYKAAGQQLTIDNGRLIFANDPIRSPRLDIHARKTIKVIGKTSSIGETGLLEETPSTDNINALEVGVHLTGHIEKPDIALYSIPAVLSQSDILSYIILDKPVNKADEAGGLLLLRAASTLKLGNTQLGDFTSQLQQKLGIDDIGFSTIVRKDEKLDKKVEQAAFGVGKQLSPHLYLHYAVGLFDPFNVVKLRYQIRKRWHVETEASNDSSGIDLFYRFERD